jgi:hypothetical protein
MVDGRCFFVRPEVKSNTTEEEIEVKKAGESGRNVKDLKREQHLK